MAIKIVQKNDEVLRQKAKEVSVGDIKSAEIKNVLKQMTKALAKTENGVAIAAPQIGVSLRIFIVDALSAESDADDARNNKQSLSPLVFINPKITKLSKKVNTVNEGCLSIEGCYGTIERAEKISVGAYDGNGKKFSRGASGLLAQIFQHEIDHLDGILFTDKATSLEEID